METKVIRSEDKNFEEEKIKMFQPKTLNKEEQLRLVFKKLLIDMLNETEDFLCHDFEDLAKQYANLLVKEVTIRVKL